jgi:hypothetical protein
MRLTKFFLTATDDEADSNSTKPLEVSFSAVCFDNDKIMDRQLAGIETERTIEED